MEHSLLVQIMPKQIHAAETVWWAMFVCQKERKINEQIRESLVKASLWLSDDIRLGIFQFLTRADADLAFGDDVTKSLELVRRHVLDIARVGQVEHFLARRDASHG